MPEKGLRYLIEAYKGLNIDKKLVIAGGSSDTDEFTQELKSLVGNNENIIFTSFVAGRLREELYSNAYVYQPVYVRSVPSIPECIYLGCCWTLMTCNVAGSKNGRAYARIFCDSGRFTKDGGCETYDVRQDEVICKMKEAFAEEIGLAKHIWDSLSFIKETVHDALHGVHGVISGRNSRPIRGHEGTMIGVKMGSRA